MVKLPPAQAVLGTAPHALRQQAPGPPCRDGLAGTAHSGHSAAGWPWLPQPGPRSPCPGLTPLAPRSSTGASLRKSLSRPWEAVGASCERESWRLPQGEEGLVGCSDGSLGAGKG